MKFCQGDGRVPKERQQASQGPGRVSPCGKVREVNLKGLRALSPKHEEKERLFSNMKRGIVLSKKKKLEERV